MNESNIKKLLLASLVIVIFGIFILVASPNAEEGQIVITVSAASSLTEAFTDIAREYEAANPDTKVELNLAGSGTLRTQIESGAPVDVFASASEEDMDILSQKNLIEETSRKDFAANTLVMVIPKNSGSKSPKNLKDLTADSVEKIAVGNPESAPVGEYTKQALETAGVWDKIESKVVFAENVKQVLTYVETGEVDAGFVYVTDAESGKKSLYEIAYTVPVNEPISYPIAVVKSSENKDEIQDEERDKGKNKEKAQGFVDFVTGSRGQEILTEYGFKLPDNKNKK